MKKLQTIEQFLSEAPTPIRRLMERLRSILQTTIPNHIEAIYPGWGLIGYRITQGHTSKYFAYIAPTDDGVKLGFEYGILLPDPHAILEGKGTRVRYVVVRHMSDIKKKQLAPLIWEAAMIAVDHSLKRKRKG
jgi:hypothetical protein